MSFHDVKMGLERPVGLDEQMRIHSDVSAMRKAIFFGQWDSSLIRACLDRAAHAGLSGEETYVLLAYQALISLEGFYQDRLELTRLDIRAPWVMPEKKP